MRQLPSCVLGPQICSTSRAPLLRVLPADAMHEVSCSWRLAPDAGCGASEDAAVSSALALRDDCAQHGAQWEPPLNAALRLEQAAAGGPCELSGARAHLRCFV